MKQSFISWATLEKLQSNKDEKRMFRAQDTRVTYVSQLDWEPPSQKQWQKCGMVLLQSTGKPGTFYSLNMLFRQKRTNKKPSWLSWSLYLKQEESNLMWEIWAVIEKIWKICLLYVCVLLIWIWSQRRALWNQFSSSRFTWVPGSKLRPSGLNLAYFYSISHIAGLIKEFLVSGKQ